MIPLPACPLWQADQPGPYRNCPVTHHASYTTLWDTIRWAADMSFEARNSPVLCDP